MFLLKCLPLVALIAVAFSANPGVKIRLTQKGLEYGRQLGMASLVEKLKTTQIPDFSGTERVSPIGKVKYSLTNIHVVNLGLPQSSINLVPGSGVQLSISNAFINLRGNWRVKYLRIIKDSGSLDVNVNGLSISQTIAIKSDATGKPEVSSASCSASVSSAKVKFHGGASWLYNLFSKFIDKALRKALEKQMCPLVAKSIADLNPHLKTLNVLAKVDKYAEIEYSMVSSPQISQPAIDLNLKGEFYNIGRHQEAPFTAPAFSLPAQSNNMIYIALSSYTPNSAGFVYKNAGVLSMYVTDDMIPRSSPIRLSTSTFGFFIPQIAKQFPGLMMKMLVKADKNPVVKFQPNTMTLEATATATAYAIQPNGTLSPLFVLNVDTSVSSAMSVSDLKLAGRITLDKMTLSLGTSYVGDFQVNSLNNILQVILELVVIPTVNVQLSKGYPLPALGKMKLVNTQLQIMQDYMLIGTDVQFTG